MGNVTNIDIIEKLNSTEVSELCETKHYPYNNSLYYLILPGKIKLHI